MYEKKIGSIVVVDEWGKPVGIMTERDVVYACAKGLSADTPIWMIMTENPVAIGEDAPLVVGPGGLLDKNRGVGEKRGVFTS